MPGGARIRLQRQPQSGLNSIADVDEATLRVASTMELHRFTGASTEHRPGNDSVELLAGPIHIGRTGEHHRKAVGLVETVQMQIAGGPAHGIGRAGGVVIVFANPALIGAAVHLGGGDVHVFLQESALPKGIVKSHLAHHIGLIPVGGIQPALGHHPLGGEVHHVAGLHPINQLQKLSQLAVEIDGVEVEVLRGGEWLARCWLWPAVGKKNGIRFI